MGKQSRRKRERREAIAVGVSVVPRKRVVEFDIYVLKACGCGSAIREVEDRCRYCEMKRTAMKAAVRAPIQVKPSLLGADKWHYGEGMSTRAKAAVACLAAMWSS